jgi:hypothetical protein
MVRVSEHLKSFSAVNVSAEVAARALGESLERFGPVRRAQFSTTEEGLDYLLPIKSFTTRFLVLGSGPWSLLVSDMKGENCYVDAYAISRTTLCRSISVSLLQDRRELHLFEGGRRLRQVQSLCDGERWYYREEGLLQPFEDAAECVTRKKSDRLSVDALQRYFNVYTGIGLRNWNNTPFTPLIGLQRSLKDVQVQISEFETLKDI